MRGFVRVMAACAAAVMVSSCGGDDGGSGDGGSTGFSAADLQGTWVACRDFGNGSSQRDVLAISGAGFTFSSTSHANATCAGAGTPIPANGESGTFTLGSTVTANLNGSPVTARQLDFSALSGTFYDLVYLDFGATPDRLYFGDSSGTNDGSSSALRPTTLAGGPQFMQRQ
jgi:hypothetical protein